MTQRPIHCTDRKREIIYIKDMDKWEKEGEDNSKFRSAIKKVSHKNIAALKEFRKKYPDCEFSSSRHSDRYCKMIIEVMGGAGDNDKEKEDKIIHNVSQSVCIEKCKNSLTC